MPERSDKYAKLTFCKLLEEEGYSDVRIARTPADIRAKKDGKDWWFELKKTSEHKKYFGAVTLTELKKAIEADVNFRFVIAEKQTEEGDGYNCNYTFYRMTLAEFIENCHPTIPPFKIYFNLKFDNIKTINFKYSGYIFTTKEYQSYQDPLPQNEPAVSFKESHIGILSKFMDVLRNKIKILI